MVGVGTLGLLAAAAERSPVLVVADDVQWLDEPTSDALAFALRRLEADAVAAIFASRSGGLGELGRSVDLTWEISPLDEESAEAVLSQGGRPSTPWRARGFSLPRMAIRSRCWSCRGA